MVKTNTSGLGGESTSDRENPRAWNNPSAKSAAIGDILAYLPNDEKGGAGGGPGRSASGPPGGGFERRPPTQTGSRGEAGRSSTRPLPAFRAFAEGDRRCDRNDDPARV